MNFVFAGLVLASALLAIFFGRARHAKGRGTLYLIVIAAMFGLGVLNAFQHARDGWHSVGTLGLMLSILCSILALIAAFIAYGTQTVEKRA